MNPPSYNEAIQQPSPSAPPPTDGFIDYQSGSKTLNPPNTYPYPYPGSPSRIVPPPVPQYYPQSPGPTTQFLDISSQQQEPPPPEEVEFGWRQQRAYCPNCRQYTRTELEAGVNDQCTWVTAITCCLGALACGSCFLGVFPLICLSTKKHMCPICKLKIGEHVPRTCCSKD